MRKGSPLPAAWAQFGERPSTTELPNEKGAAWPSNGIVTPTFVGHTTHLKSLAALGSRLRWRSHFSQKLHDEARIEHENKHGHVALSWATIKDRQPQMEALVKRGADVNYRSKKHGRTPLIWAAIFGKHRSVRFLLEAGADQTIEDDDGKT